MSITHYYGDAVRAFFIGLAALIAVSVPLSGNLQLGMFFGIPSVVIIVLLAGFTNPRGTTIMILNAVASVAGVFFAEVIAIIAYNNGDYIPFALMECIAVLFLPPLYFSVKTARAMVAHQIGHHDQWWEFEEADKKKQQ